MIAWAAEWLMVLSIAGSVLLAFVLFENSNSATIKHYWHIAVVSLLATMVFGWLPGIIHPMLIPLPGIMTFIYLCKTTNGKHEHVETQS